ncbi:hypothetical protein L7F22_010059 [Adiantum nelumboides]|nr:hypothetical protein [Adiantum nelumboides]
MGNGADEAASYALLDAYFAQGGNFIDMANNYQDGESERILGAWMRARGNRDELVITSKYTSTFKFQQGPAAGVHISANFNGNAKKSLRLSLDHTLASLGTDYVDILYVHWWDWTTSVEEMMQALNREVQAGRVLYLGASDMPAWVVSSANAYARAHALAPFSVYEGLWSILQRDMERDIVPMCRAEGMPSAPGAPWAGASCAPKQRSRSASVPAVRYVVARRRPTSRSASRQAWTRWSRPTLTAESQSRSLL